MKSPEEMEKALQRLMPPALSTQAHANISAMIASLAAAEPSRVDDLPAQTDVLSLPITKRIYWRAVAAAIAIGTITTVAWQLSHQEPTELIVEAPTKKSTVPTQESGESPVLIDRMLVTDGMTVEGTLTAADGTMIHQVKRRVETRERYRDAKHGYLITVSETRDEKVYLPKKGF